MSGEELVVLIAHPDDEGMFMAPVLGRVGERYGMVRVVCLSTGNADGLGEVRVKELVKSAALFGVGEGEVAVLDDARFQDGLDAVWKVDDLVEALLPVITTPSTHILTFDIEGVSRHPNHIATSQAAHHLFRTHPPITALYQVVTVPLLFKYTSFLAGFLKFGDMTVTTATPHLCFASMISCHWSQMVWYRWLYITFSRYSFAVDLNVLRK
eukprot:TRINITY_DN43291_c0_g1_i1.p1 TRINITY_DN43291_c0_g1~~TRINITY_DN43291_c0_g1_i1.p1  ORF type:complete len:245 (+),score=52.23 TRINITY_DN43291_c0_g1_i1:103-735(+)